MTRYRYVWGNNVKRAQLKGRVCELLFCSVGHSACVRFVDDGSIECVSRRALRRIR
jgi:hypothetical protein